MRIICLLVLLFPACMSDQKAKQVTPHLTLDKIATEYVRLGLNIGQYDADFVDAYYGPDSLKPASAKNTVFPKDSLLSAVKNLQDQLQPHISESNNDTLSNRASWINSQLTAFGRRIKMFSGEKSSFDIQAQELFGVTPPTYTEEHFRTLLQTFDKLLPGKGSVDDRYKALANRFIIPKEKLDTTIKATIAESKRRTKEHFDLPTGEDFRLEYVTNKPWSGYNWYQGNYKSLIQINTDVTAYVESVIDVASHEGYPGHHVYNSLLEKNLYKNKGWIEISLYPLFSPQSLIAEGSANYGIEVAFPNDEKIKFAKETLLPLAGMDTTGITAYYHALSLKKDLLFVRIEITRRLLEGKMTDAEALKWLKDFNMMNEKEGTRQISFMRKYESYVMNYTYGKALVKDYIERNGGKDDPTKRWDLFGWLLSNEVRPVDLVN